MVHVLSTYKFWSKNLHIRDLSGEFDVRGVSILKRLLNNNMLEFVDWINIAQGGDQLQARIFAMMNQELNIVGSSTFFVHLSDCCLHGKDFVPLNLKYCRVWHPVIMHLYDQHSNPRIGLSAVRKTGKLTFVFHHHVSINTMPDNKETASHYCLLSRCI